MNKATILLVFFSILITTSNVCAKGEIIIIPVPYFQNDYSLITTEGDSVTYSFNIINIGNETIEDQKVWYNIMDPSGNLYVTQRRIQSGNIRPINITKLGPREEIVELTSRFCLKNAGQYTLYFGINSRGDESLDNEVLINGMDYTRYRAQDNFHVYEKDLILVCVVTIFGILIGIFKLKK